MAGTKINYTAFAQFLASYPDELTLLRFRELSIRNLLFYQAELVHLTRQLQQLENYDAEMHPEPENRVNHRWTPAMAAKPREIRTSGADDVSAATTTLDLYCEKILEIRETLAKYSEALDRYAQQERLRSPSKGTIESLSQWLSQSNFGKSFLKGSFEDVWNSPRDTEDFMTFVPTAGLASRISQAWVILRPLLSRRAQPNRVYSINSSSEKRVAQGFSIIISSVFPVLPIVILFFIKRPVVRIGLILVFTAVFAAVLVFGLKLEPEKVLAITSAIAAVQVVYVGSTADCPSS